MQNRTKYFEQESIEGVISNSASYLKKIAINAGLQLVMRTRRLKKLGITPQIVDEVTNEEFSRTEQYINRMVERLEVKLRDIVLSSEPKVDKLDSWEQIINREFSYMAAHVDAADKRLERAIEISDTFDKSPRGAIWKLGDAKNHTPDCLFMGNKAWTWDILLQVNPQNRHYGCKCSIVPIPADYSLPIYNVIDPQMATIFFSNENRKSNVISNVS